MLNKGWFTSLWSRIATVGSCATDAADSVSLANAVEHAIPGLGDGAGKVLTDAALGNSYTGVADAVFSPSLYNSAQLASSRLGVSDALQNGVARGLHAAISVGGSLTDLAGTVSTVALTGAEYASGFGELKATYDGATLGLAALGCLSGLIH